MKKAYLISTGTELLLGSTIDTNSVFLSVELAKLGIRVVGKSTIGDSKEHLEKAFSVGLDSAEILITTGGLGPTFDDLTKTVACEMMDCKLIQRDEEVKKLKEFFSRRQRKMPEINLKQAMFPKEATVIKNERGTAPGMYLAKNDKIIILLPGPPSEMKPMFKKEVVPLLEKDFSLDLHKIINRTIKVLGPGESTVEEMLGDIMENRQGCSMALLAVDGEIHIKLTAEGNDLQASQIIINQLNNQIVEKMGKYVFGFDDVTIPSKVYTLLQEKGEQLALAESCTGGLVAKMITDIPGSSQIFWGGVNSYSNEAKLTMLGVKRETLDHYGAVSSQTAEEMARGIVACSGASYGVSITGIAGPDGGTQAKPVGLVYIGVAMGDICKVKELRFVGSRDAIRNVAAKSALDLLRRYIESDNR